METHVQLPQRTPLMQEINTSSESRQLKKIIDNRPSQIMQAKMISVMQKKSVVQKQKISELDADQQVLVKMYSLDFKRILFPESNNASIVKIKIDSLDLAPECLQQAITTLQQTIKERIDNAVTKSLSLGTQTFGTDTEKQKASFDKVGVNGRFDMELSDKDVIVKVIFKLNNSSTSAEADFDKKIDGSKIHIAKEAVNGVNSPTIEAIVAAWAKNDVFQKGDDKYSVKIHISIEGKESTNTSHYNYYEGQNHDDPAEVLREEKRFRVRQIGVNSESAIHEFGHVLGLDEEYQLDDFTKNDLHHEWLLKKYYGKETYKVPATDKPDDEETNTKSIMGTGDQIFGRHYIGVLNALCSLKGTNFADWKILIPGEASEL